MTFSDFMNSLTAIVIFIKRATGHLVQVAEFPNTPPIILQFKKIVSEANRVSPLKSTRTELMKRERKLAEITDWSV